MNERKAGVVLICGRIAAGKSTYAEKLRLQRRAVVLSCDEIMLSVFGRDAGADHDRFAQGTQEYLCKKSLEILALGVDVILDWGFWQRKKRRAVREFYRERGIPCEMHCVEVSDAQWRENIIRRNAAVLAGEIEAYYVDEGLAAKSAARFEPPSPDEIDVWVRR